MSMKHKWLRPLALLLATPAAWGTNGYFLPGYGTNSKAQAGVGIALPLDSLTVATNPAGLTEVSDGITGGVEVFRPRRAIRNRLGIVGHMPRPEPASVDWAVPTRIRFRWRPDCRPIRSAAITRSFTRLKRSRSANTILSGQLPAVVL